MQTHMRDFGTWFPEARNSRVEGFRGWPRSSIVRSAVSRLAHIVFSLVVQQKHVVCLICGPKALAPRCGTSGISSGQLGQDSAISTQRWRRSQVLLACVVRLFANSLRVEVQTRLHILLDGVPEHVILGSNLRSPLTNHRLDIFRGISCQALRRPTPPEFVPLRISSARVAYRASAPGVARAAACLCVHWLFEAPGMSGMFLADARVASSQSSVYTHGAFLWSSIVSNIVRFVSKSAGLATDSSRIGVDIVST